MTRYVYISLAGANKIAIFTQDGATGKLIHKEDVALEGPGPMAVSPTKPVLYACLRGVPATASLRIDPSTGSLTSIGSVGMDEGPAMISTDRTGRFLFGAYYGSGSISVNPIDGDGVAGEPQIQRESTDERAHYIQVDASNKFVIVPHVLPGNALFVFKLDADTGQLTTAGPPVKPPEGEGPRHFCFHPNQKFIFTANEDSSTVTSYGFDNQTGALSQVQTVSTLPPEGYTPGPEANSCSQIRITPNGKFLYAPNRGHDSVTCFRVGDEGGLDTIGYVPGERHVRGTAMDPDGKYLYTTGTQSGNMASYAISQQTGALEPLEIIEVGETPMWIEIVDQA
jgi:6-phosphogluconolactonase